MQAQTHSTHIHMKRDGIKWNLFGNAPNPNGIVTRNLEKQVCTRQSTLLFPEKICAC